MITIAIQAGGRSKRMGTDKGLALLAGKPMIEHVIERVNGLGDEILITSNDRASYAYLGCPLVSDAEPGAGALPGLQTALSAAKGELVLVVACDMPLLNRELLAYQLQQAVETGADVVVPMWQAFHETLHAVYRRQPVLAAASAALAQGKKRMISFYDGVRVAIVPASVVAQFDPAGHTFFNANTPAELAEAERLLAKP